MGLGKLAIASSIGLSVALSTALIAVPRAIALEHTDSRQPSLAEPKAGRTQALAPQTFAPQTFAPQTFALRVVLSLSERRVNVYRGEMLTASYEVAVGREGWNTPTGEFSVFQKQVDPAWEHPFTGVVVPPGPDNPLGSRWIGFWSDGVNSIGFHGTPDESLIGSAVSHGCVRMRNADVLALYEQVGLDTPVTVLP